MAQFSDWISRMFATGQARGLSGDADDLALGPQAAFYNSRLRRHQAGDDLIENPALIWSCQVGGRRRAGLREHLLAFRSEGPPDFTDVLVVVNDTDWRRTWQRVTDPWPQYAARVLSQELTQFSGEEGFEPLYPERGFRFFFIQDGGSEMQGEGMGLLRGEFVTGLLPNLYTGPALRSRPVIAVHLNIPGAWEGYQEVGRLYSDQVQFTLGNHWLDSFSHSALREPALYRLQQYLDGSFLHIISPDLQDRYEVHSDDADGTSVLTLSAIGGPPIAYLVLALLDTSSSELPLDEEPPRGPVPLRTSTTDFPSADPTAPPGPRPSALGIAGQKTIIPDSVQERILSLRERGALLQKIHFRKFMRGYDVYVSEAGTVSTQEPDPAATFQVRDDRVQLVVHKPAVLVNGARVALHQPLALADRTVLQVGPHTLEYNDLTRVRIDGWPYLGEILRPASSTHMVFGGRYRIGRDRRCKVQLPDEPHNDNIVWLEGATSGNTIRARSGDIPKSRFYTDSIMVGSEHVEVNLRDEAQLQAINKSCYTFVRRNGEVMVLPPAAEGGPPRTLALRNEDELLVGNCLFRLSFIFPSNTATGEITRPRRITADSLLQGAGLEDSSFVDEPPAPARPPSRPPPAPPRSTDPPRSDPPPAAPRPRSGPMRPEDLPAAAGLGERGPAPEPPRIDPASLEVTGLPPDPRPAPRPEPVKAEPPRAEPVKAEPPKAEPPRSEPPKAEPPRPALQPLPDAVAARAALSQAELPTVRIGEEDEEPAPEDEAPLTPAREQEDDIIAVVDESEWQLDMARPARLLQVGWAITGEVTIGNFKDCQVVIPESRSEPHQLFHAAEYIQLKVRGGRGKAVLLDPQEARLRVNGEEQKRTLELDGLELEVIRRDSDHEEDFSVVLRLDASLALPDPRAQLLAIDTRDRMAQALFTTGLPLKAVREVALGAIRARALYDGQGVVLSDHLRTYRLPDGRFRPFFLRQGEGEFRTVPEDGHPIRLNPGDWLLADNVVYRFWRREDT